MGIQDNGLIINYKQKKKTQMRGKDTPGGGKRLGIDNIVFPPASLGGGKTPDLVWPSG